MHHKRIKGKDKYVFKKYNSTYRRAFGNESSMLYAKLGRENVSIEHIGSKPLLGLAAKTYLT